MVERKKLADIEYGTIIDHIPAGESLEVLNALQLPLNKKTVSLLINTDSKKFGKKDIIKIEDEHLDPKGIARKIRKIAPRGTVSWVENHTVITKLKIMFL